ncbi:hypothetical protein DFJ77DRAFT_127894 [Powellomyces hirtus]|nr:hypothetical protein DFJ77DRAFT_127894 [Powellomyces hirtus]
MKQCAPCASPEERTYGESAFYKPRRRCTSSETVPSAKGLKIGVEAPCNSGTTCAHELCFTVPESRGKQYPSLSNAVGECLYQRIQRQWESHLDRYAEGLQSQWFQMPSSSGWGRPRTDQPATLSKTNQRSRKGKKTWCPPKSRTTRGVPPPYIPFRGPIRGVPVLCKSRDLPRRRVQPGCTVNAMRRVEVRREERNVVNGWIGGQGREGRGGRALARSFRQLRTHPMLT